MALAWNGLLTAAFTDYEVEAEPALQALRTGHVLRFLEALPAYGGSLILRAPFALLPRLWHGGDVAMFRSMAAPCLVATVALGVALWARGDASGASRPACWLALALTGTSPIALWALDTGHPEELLGGVLAIAAVLAATSERPLAAGVLVGLAVASKPWALVVVVPVLVALPAGRRRALLGAAAAGGAVLAPMLLTTGAGLHGTLASARTAGTIFQPWQVFWFFGDHGHHVVGIHGDKVGYRAAPDWAGSISHPLLVLVAVAVAVGVAATRHALRGGHALGAGDALALLTLVLVLRCLLDTWNVSYYAFPACAALVAWELEARRRAPVVGLVVILLTWTTFALAPSVASPDLQSLLYLSWSVPEALLLGWMLLHPASWHPACARARAAFERRLPALTRAWRSSDDLKILPQP